MGWNFNMDEAPRGSYREVKTKKGTRRVHITQQVQTLADNNDVRVSYYLPDEKRWCFYTKKRPPIAWANLLEPPKEAV